MATISICDHCDVLLSEPTHGRAQIRWRTPGEKIDEQDYDLCPTCLGMLMQLLRKDQWVLEPA